MAKKLAVLFVALEISIFAGIAALSICMRRYLKPFIRGFFKDDQSIMHPFHSSTISSTMLYCVGFTVPGGVMFLTEIVYARLNRNTRNAGKVIFLRFLWSFYHIFGLFMFGAAVTHLLTNIPKYTIGRLRPHFFAICQPNWSKVKGNSSYIVEDICAGEDKDLIYEARLSFPSGHSSMAMYCAFVFMFYLEKRLKSKNFILFCPTLQLAAFAMAFYTCLSRISDYKHHWSDVLVGAILGIGIAYAIMLRMTQVVFKKKNVKDASSSMELPSSYPQYSSSQLHPAISTNF